MNWNSDLCVNVTIWTAMNVSTFFEQSTTHCFRYILIITDLMKRVHTDIVKILSKLMCQWEKRLMNCLSANCLSSMYKCRQIISYKESYDNLNIFSPFADFFLNIFDIIPKRYDQERKCHISYNHDFVHKN